MLLPLFLQGFYPERQQGIIFPIVYKFIKIQTD